MKICIIGAGAAGLASARQVTDSKYNYTCVIFEQSDSIGGTWIYTDKIGLDKYGLPIHTSMYKNLRTNLPKEIMCYPDFKIDDSEESYVTQDTILKFLNQYTDHFNLRQFIQFHNYVKQIEPKGNSWIVTVTNLVTKTDTIYEFDAVMVCNGHYHKPRIPVILGSEKFQGIQIHSHDFRDSQDFLDKTVLVIGAGPSGLDIAVQISKAANTVILSHHNNNLLQTEFPNNLIRKPNVNCITEDAVIFVDNSRINVDAIVYCTGYLYSFPFLNEKCGITIDDNHVKPLYKHLININYPTMCFVGVPFYVCAFSMFDLQARFFLESLKCHFTLPSKVEMLQELNEEMRELYSNGMKKKHAHMMGTKQDQYYKELSAIANIKPIPPVLAKIHNLSSEKFVKDFLHFRNDVFQILDDYNFKIIEF